MASKPESVTHSHLLSILVTEMERCGEAPVIRILDLGCGRGHMLAFLHEHLTERFPGRTFEFWGHDVADYAGSSSVFLKRTTGYLSEKVPGVDWGRFIKEISVKDPWPYPDGFFHFVLSNQVMEHVEDIEFAFAETDRVLVEGGLSVSVFPLSSYLYETHLNLPFVHKIHNFDHLKGAIKVLSRLGLGRYRSRRADFTLDGYAEHYADYMRTCTHYISHRRALELARKNHLRISFRYTQEYYFQKLRSMLRIPPRGAYRRKRSMVRDWAWLFLLKYVDCVTLSLEKKDVYNDKPGGGSGHPH